MTTTPATTAEPMIAQYLRESKKKEEEKEKTSLKEKNIADGKFGNKYKTKMYESE